jgi:hypothetical protein
VCLLAVGLAVARTVSPSSSVRRPHAERHPSWTGTRSSAARATLSYGGPIFTAGFSDKRSGSGRATRTAPTDSSDATSAQEGDGPASLSDTVSTPAIQNSLIRDATDDKARYKSLVRFIRATSIVAGMGLAVAAVLKFKQHKDNPTQISLSVPIHLLSLAQGLLYLDPFMAVASEHVFKQARGDDAGADSDRGQDVADSPRAGYARAARLLRVETASSAHPDSDGRFAHLFALQNRELRDDARLPAVGTAQAAALERASTALAAGDHVAYEKQKAAVATYLGQEATLLTRVVSLRHDVAGAFTALRVGVRISHAGMVKLAGYVRAHGLRSIRRGIEHWGVSPASVGLAGVSSSQLASQLSSPASNFVLARLFKDPARQDAADLHLAGLLGAAEQAVHKIP